MLSSHHLICIDIIVVEVCASIIKKSTRAKEQTLKLVWHKLRIASFINYIWKVLVCVSFFSFACECLSVCVCAFFSPFCQSFWKCCSNRIRILFQIKSFARACKGAIDTQLCRLDGTWYTAVNSMQCNTKPCNIIGRQVKMLFDIIINFITN